MKKSKIAPAFEVKTQNPYGLKQMIPEAEDIPLKKNTVTMNVTPIPALTNIDPMEPAHDKKIPAWKPKGRK